MKSIYRAVVSCFIILAVSLIIFNKTVLADEPGFLDRITKVCENGGFALYIDENTTAVFVLNKQSGKIWGTNPRPDEMSGLNDALRRELSMQIELRYSTPTGFELTFSNYIESVEKNQYTITLLPDGVEVLYQIGRVESMLLTPEAMQIEHFERFLAELSEEDQQSVLEQYTILSYERLPENQRDDRVSRFPLLLHEDLYVSRSINDRVRRNLDAIFKKTSLSVEFMLEQYNVIGFMSEEQSFALFNIPIRYTLADDSLIAEIETGKIEYDETNFRLITLSFLRYFGAAGAEAEGYMLIPDGSGALIDLQNDVVSIYNSDIYGTDYAYFRNFFRGYRNQVTMPVFGLKNGDDAFFAVIEEGAAGASLYAAGAWNPTRFSYISPIFAILDRESIPMPGRMYSISGQISSLPVFAENKIGSNMVVEYSFLRGGEANYSGMARKYQSMLFADKERLALSDANIPLFVESIGAVNKQIRVFGFPIRRNIPVTTYRQAAMIAERLYEAGVSNINYKLSGWQSGGINSNYFSKKVNFLSALGGRKGFTAMLEAMEAINVSLFPDVDFWYAYTDKMFNGFSVLRDITRNLTGRRSFKTDFWVDDLTPSSRTARYILSPRMLAGFVGAFANNYGSLGLSNISAGSLGMDVNSDFNKKNVITRPETIEILSDIFKSLKEQGFAVSTDYGNEYALPYVDVLYNVPSNSSGFPYEHKTVPFLQMVLSGYVEYCGEPVNLSDDYEMSILKAAENGSGLFYLINYAKDTVFLHTNITGMYSTNHEIWVEDAARQYARLNEVLKHVRGSLIYEHNFLAEDITETVYENGARIIVNFSPDDYVCEGYIVPAKDYIIIQ